MNHFGVARQPAVEIYCRTSADRAALQCLDRSSHDLGAYHCISIHEEELVTRGFARAGISRGRNLAAMHRDHARTMCSREVCCSVRRCVVGDNDLVAFTDL